MPNAESFRQDFSAHSVDHKGKVFIARSPSPFDLASSPLSQCVDASLDTVNDIPLFVAFGGSRGTIFLGLAFRLGLLSCGNIDMTTAGGRGNRRGFLEGRGCISTLDLVC